MSLNLDAYVRVSRGERPRRGELHIVGKAFLILAELLQSPYTQFTTSFLAEPPREGQ